MGGCSKAAVVLVGEAAPGVTWGGPGDTEGRMPMWLGQNVETKASVWAQRAEPLLIIAALAFLGAYAWPIIDPAISDETKSLCASVVWLTWALFVVDYGTRLFIAKDRWAFVRRNALELATVVLPMFRPLRLVRLLVVLEYVQRRAMSVRIKAGTYLATGGALLVFVGGLAITDAERGHPDALIANVGDGWWWAFVSMTTVGYGDMYPVTTTGRLVATVLMLAGIAVLGSVTGMVASWVLEQVKATNDDHERAS
ncbi:potassium channel family protein [Phytoactinopolyspora halotolerans]|uniref:Two pore domain potassium channel family protein n=1 Tax=Phytoactinopolyspora halotolerans TaxID=1981512 RepID=A0A6L9SHD6_9ACTN|nr:potassium channel family protein [Phytoactinopolyspora halotolerans]NEE04599.1 two pore domain potassium channel family protein [Phytoactinopolyspora halotolerans]